jgi:hypothetical protein
MEEKQRLKKAKADFQDGEKSTLSMIYDLEATATLLQWPGVFLRKKMLINFYP